jgi:hypothetical protein
MTSTSQEHENWTAAGSDAAAKNTYASIRKALEGIEKTRDVEIFLQGSYANATNIRADSDVDVVVMTRQTFRGASDRLGPWARARFNDLPPATFTASDLRAEVTAALRDYYGAARVHPRKKCIQVDGTSGFVDADVVPCLQYRWYTKPDSDLTRDFIEGVAIQPTVGEQIINFPKEHIKNGQSKNAACNGRYKATVRQVKRLRNRAVDQGVLADGVAPGYLLECMVYNVPPAEFVADDSKRLSNVVLWLKFASKAGFFSCDGIHRLFQTDPGKFDAATAQTILDALWEAY